MVVCIRHDYFRRVGDYIHLVGRLVSWLHACLGTELFALWSGWLAVLIFTFLLFAPGFLPE